MACHCGVVVALLGDDLHAQFWLPVHPSNENQTPAITPLFLQQESEPVYRLVSQPPVAAGIAIGNQPGGSSTNRQKLAVGIAATALTKDDARIVPAMDVATFVGTSTKSVGTAKQQRNPVTTDLRVRGSHTGQLLASGSYWVPGRFDLDTMLSKLDSRTIEDVIVIKGPYSSRYGPGLNFVDFVLLPAQRFEGGFEAGGSTSFDFQSNGERWNGRQSAWAGGEDWGIRASYGHRVGVDYRTGDNNGAGQNISGGFNSRDVEVAFGRDPTPDSHLDIYLLRLDQSRVEYPGLLWDIRSLKTDGYEVKYVHESPGIASRFEVEGWYNSTEFDATANPNIQSVFGAGVVTLARSDADATSGGYRAQLAWGEPQDAQLTVGTDLIYINTRIFDDFIVNATPIFEGIPESRSIDFGIFLEHEVMVGDSLLLKAGARADAINNSASEMIRPFVTSPGAANTFDALSSFFESPLQQNINTWSVFLTGTYEFNDAWTLKAGVGHGQRPPTLTEMYTASTPMGILQQGLTFVFGDPQLAPERLTQFDLGLSHESENVRVNANYFFGFVKDYVAIDLLGSSAVAGASVNNVAFVNTNALLSGVELIGEIDWTDRVTAFGTLSYVHGQDITRNRNSRERRQVLMNLPRSTQSLMNILNIPSEPLPGMPPLESQVGLRLHDDSPQPRWAIEFMARIVNEQRRVAATLGEVPTPGFTIFNIRAHAQVTDRLLLIMGMDNVGDRFYREHIDFRTPFNPIFQPGRSFYFGSDFTY